MAQRTETMYTPGPVPVNDAELRRYIGDEFRKIQTAMMNMTIGYKKVWYAPPERPEMGMKVYADGTLWNPGSGEGWYGYSSTGDWVQLG